MQGAIAAGLLGCGSVVLGAAQEAGRLLLEVERRAVTVGDTSIAAREVLTEWRAASRAIAGYGHPQHKAGDPRVARLFEVARTNAISLRYLEIAQILEREIDGVLGKKLKLNVSAAIPAVLLGAGFPTDALRGIPLPARTASLIAHVVEETARPIGFALAHAGAVAVAYDGPTATTPGE